MLLSGDIEENPGPVTEALLLTLNCRGLKKQNKFKQLTNRLYKSHNISNDFIAALQETHLEISNLSYSWKGSHIFTPGSGSKGGCITLLSENMTVIESTDIGNEGHVAIVISTNNNSQNCYIIANIHAPCAHDEKKVNFFTQVKESIDSYLMRYDDSNIVIMGDFNTAFKETDRINTIYSTQEVNVANRINDILCDLLLTDCWDTQTSPTMTWRHGKKMSKLDRIRLSDINEAKIEISTDWSYITSDHCAVIVKIKPIQNPIRTRVTRIDTRFMGDAKLRDSFLKELDSRVLQTKATNLNPHGQLEFLKMSIRSIAIEISAAQNKLRKQEFADLKNDLNFWQKSLETAKISYLRDMAENKLDELISRRDKLLTDRGEYLSARMNSRWYQESERSTKYFLNLQRAKTKKTEMLSIMDCNGSVITDQSKIKNNVETFYKSLYEKGDRSQINQNLIHTFIEKLPTLNTPEADEITKTLSVNDLLTTLKTCKDSAPGPDGIPYSLIKLTWKHFGPLLLNSWLYSQETGELTQSHNSSYLRLLPKEGKDTNFLKNWRPITLSNCDFKIITKCLANKLTTGLSKVISPHQTAYIKGRQITDNLQTLLFTIDHALKENIPAMIVSLDAEKAFDSVEHWYLKEILKKIGLNNFVSTFDTLYKNQTVDILLNGNIAGSYKIKNGVKQGDALSCILFILGIEPLIRNINNDNRITGVKTSDFLLPTTLAYADDIACIVTPSQQNLKLIFNHYDNLTKLSGLKLNADKTEILEIKGRGNYSILYDDKSYEIKAIDSIKINGIQLLFDMEKIRKVNFEKTVKAVSNQLMSWSQRHLSILGKILIVKTFGLSQILYVASCLKFSKPEETKLNELIYKFIWNKNMHLNKAPDRIKRDILEKNIQSLGFGMIDYRKVVSSIRIKMVIRLLSSNSHPLSLILTSLISKSIINPMVLSSVTDTVNDAVSQINKIWKTYIKNHEPDSKEELKNFMLNEYIGNLIEPRYRNKRLGLYYKHFTIREVLELNPRHPILNKLRRLYIPLVESCQMMSIPNQTGYQQTIALPLKKGLTYPHKITSKLIRESLQSEPRTTCKMLKDVSPNDLSKLGHKISRLTNVKLKSIILRTLHGDIYSGNRLKRFGMKESDECPRCGITETREHLLYECEYVKGLWQKLSMITSIPHTSINYILGIHDLHDKITLAIHGEMIRRLLALDRPTQDQWNLIKSVIKRIFICERTTTKYHINQMLNEVERIMALPNPVPDPHQMASPRLHPNP